MMLQTHWFKFRWFRLLLIILVGVGIWGFSPQQVVHSSPLTQSSDVPRFEERNCWEVLPEHDWTNVDLKRFRCGYFVTWKNYDSQTGTIRLAVMETYPPGILTDILKPAPILWLAGGPGGSGFQESPTATIQRTNNYRRGWIQFSQRGSYFSQPELYCPAYREEITRDWETLIEGRPLRWEQWFTVHATALVECYESLGRKHGYDYFPSVNSKFNALDVIYLIRKLGYGNGNINLYGGSYGTLLAQHVLALSPGDVKSVVLHGVAPLGVDWVAEGPVNMRESLQRIFEACDKSEECLRVYPDLKDTLLLALDQLKEEPLCLPIDDGALHFSNVCLDDYGFLRALNQMLYATENIKIIPRIIYAARYQDPAQAKELGPNYYTYERNVQWPWGMYYSIYCTEFTSFDPNGIDLSRLEPQFLSLYTASDQLAFHVCPLYDPHNASYGDANVVNNKVPILIFNGKFDPATPPKYGDRVAQSLSPGNVYQFTSEISAHDMAPSICTFDIMRDFFNDPKTPPDRTCWENEQNELKTIDFELVIINPGSEPPLGSETPWSPELPEIDPDILNTWLDSIQSWWHEQQKSIEEGVDRWWQEQQDRFNDALDQWWQDFQKQLVEWFWRQYIELLNQCFGTALLPACVLASVWRYRRNRGRVQK